MSEQNNSLTPELLKKYNEELEYLLVTRRLEVSQKLKEARTKGDLWENHEYIEAKEEQIAVENRINQIRQILNLSIVNDDTNV